MKVKQMWGLVAAVVMAGAACGADLSFLGDPAAVRERWDRLARRPDAQQLVDTAATLAAQPMPDYNEADYLLYIQTGNRTIYQEQYERRLENMRKLALAECVEHQGRFVPRLREYVDWTLTLRSWTLPAHDDDLASWNGKPSIDLVVARHAQELALIVYWLGEEMGDDLAARIRQELERRVFSVYAREVVAMEKAEPDWRRDRAWWIKGQNNWNAVCHCGVAAAVMILEPDGPRKASLLRAIRANAMRYFDNIPADGYCEEGAGYWSYGFGRGMSLLLLFDNYENGAFAFTTGDNVRRMAAYGSSFLMAPGRSPTISDCGRKAAPGAVTAALAAKRYPEAVPACYEGTWSVARGSDLLPTALLAFAPSRTVANRATTALSIRDWWPSFTVLISRQRQDTPHPLSVCVNGGSNRSSHAHHDAGSYSLFVDDVELLCDPGSPVYTRSTFGKDRYKNQLVNSYGHAVPVVNGKLQGGTAKGVGDGVARPVARCFGEDRDELTLDLRPAYAEAGERKLERTVVFDREKSELAVTDVVEFAQSGSFEVPFITRAAVVRTAPFQYELTLDGRRLAVRFAAEGCAIEETESEVNDRDATGSGIKRIAVRFIQPVTRGRIILTAVKL